MNAPKLRDPFEVADELVRQAFAPDRFDVVTNDEFIALMAAECVSERRERAQEMDREAGLLDDEAVTDYRNRRGE